MDNLIDFEKENTIRRRWYSGVSTKVYENKKYEVTIFEGSADEKFFGTQIGHKNYKIISNIETKIDYFYKKIYRDENEILRNTYILGSYTHYDLLYTEYLDKTFSSSKIIFSFKIKIPNIYFNKKKTIFKYNEAKQNIYGITNYIIIEHEHALEKIILLEKELDNYAVLDLEPFNYYKSKFNKLKLEYEKKLEDISKKSNINFIVS
jgi:hypothetical protein